MNKRVVIFGNGTLDKNFLTLLKFGDYIVGVDRAAYWLILNKINLNVAIGDFDSTTAAEFRRIKKSVKRVETYSPEKDWTDMELAVRHAIGQKPTEVVIVGGIGSRMDHTVATWHLLDALLTAKIPHVLVNEKNRIRLVSKGRTILSPKGEYRYISIVPYSESILVKLSGFRYDIPKTKLIRGSTLGVSNELSGNRGVIEIFAGKSWVIESAD